MRLKDRLNLGIVYAPEDQGGAGAAVAETAAPEIDAEFMAELDALLGKPEPTVEAKESPVLTEARMEELLAGHFAKVSETVAAATKPKEEVKPPVPAAQAPMPGQDVALRRLTIQALMGDIAKVYPDIPQEAREEIEGKFNVANFPTLEALEACFDPKQQWHMQFADSVVGKYVRLGNYVPPGAVAAAQARMAPAGGGRPVDRPKVVLTSEDQATIKEVNDIVVALTRSTEFPNGRPLDNDDFERSSRHLQRVGRHAMTMVQ